jgi:glycosyltransferase involved in cell wall biosynthesis
VTALVPHAPGAKTEEWMEGVRVKRFRYFQPESGQKLCYGGGILPNLQDGWLARINLPFFVLAQGGAALRELKNGGYDVVHCHWLLPQGFFLSILSGITGIPYLVTAHGSDIFTENPLFRALNRRTLAKTCCCTVNSSRTLERVGRLQRRIRTAIVPMGVDPSSFHEGRRSPIFRRKMGDGHPQILFAGRFTRTKGINFLLEAISLILLELPGAKLALVGFGTEEEKIRRLITANRLQGAVRLLGGVPGKEIPGYMASADLFVLPSVGWEGLGVVLLEALACGTPVVGTDVGGISDVIRDGETGLLCREGDPLDLAEKCLEMLGNPDFQKRSVRKASWMIEEHYSWPVIAGKFEELLESCRGRGGEDR